VGRHQRTSSVAVTIPRPSSYLPGASGLGPEGVAEPDIETVLDELSTNADGNARETDTNLNSDIEVDVGVGADLDRIDVDGQQQERQRYFALLPALTNTDHPHHSIQNLNPQGSTAFPTTSENDIHRLPLPLSSASLAGTPRQRSIPPVVITESITEPKAMGTSTRTTSSTTITKRHMKLVFAPWTGGTHKRTWTDHDGNEIKIVGDEVEYEIWKGGIRSL